MMIKCIIFDNDGTLVDSENLCNLGLVITLKNYGIDASEGQLVSDFRGVKLADILATMEDIYNVKFDTEFVLQYRKIVDELFEMHLKPVEGVVAMLKQLDIPICVASSGPMEKIERSLALTGISDYFCDRIFSSYTINSWKPEPDLFLHAARELNVHPEGCLVVEDSKVGIIAANRAKMQACLYDPVGCISIDNEYQYTLIKRIGDIIPLLNANTH